MPQPPGSGQPQDARQLVRRSSVVSAFTLVAIATGFAVDVLIAARFGVGDATDAFLGAYALPLVFISLAAASQRGLISLLAHEDGGLPTASALTNWIGLIMAGAAAVGIGAGPLLVQLIVPGLPATSAGLASGLVRILFVRVPLDALSEVGRAHLYVRGRYALASVSMAVPSLVTLAILGWARTAQDIYAVAWSFAIGAGCQLLLLAAVLRLRFGWRHRWTLGRGDPALRPAAGLLLAPLVGVGLRQGVRLVERMLASFLPPGSVTVVSLATKLTNVSAAVLFDSLTTASMPSLTRHLARSDRGAARTELRRLLKLALGVGVPIGLAAVALGQPGARLLFEWGRVTADAADYLGWILAWYCLGLPFLGPFRAAQAYFFAAQRPWPVVILFAGVSVTTVTLDLALVGPLGAQGLALGYAAGLASMTAASLVWVVRDMEGLGWPGARGSLARLAAASGILAAVAYATSRILAARSGVLVGVAGGGLIGGLAFMAAARLLRLDLLDLVLDRLADWTGIRWVARPKGRRG